MARAVAELAVDTDALVDPGLVTERVRRIVRRLSGVLAPRIRIYGLDGQPIADSRMLTGPGGTVQIQPLPPPEPDPVRRFANKLYDRVVNWLPKIGRAHAELQSLMRISYAVICLKKKT